MGIGQKLSIFAMDEQRDIHSPHVSWEAKTRGKQYSEFPNHKWELLLRNSIHSIFNYQVQDVQIWLVWLNMDVLPSTMGRWNWEITWSTLGICISWYEMTHRSLDTSLSTKEFLHFPLVLGHHISPGVVVKQCLERPQQWLSQFYAPQVGSHGNDGISTIRGHFQ
jgi:hypothetical protein